MKKAVKSFVFGMGIILSLCRLPAQDTISFHSYEGAIDTIFGAIDTNLYPSGILLNMAPYDEGFLASDGININSPQIKWNEYLFYHEVIKNASKKRYCDDDIYTMIMAAQEEHLEDHTVLVSVLNFTYHFINDQHFDNGNLSWENPQISINTGNPSSIFEKKRCFVMGPLIGNTISKEVIFKIPQEKFFTNDSAAIDSILFDFGDGNGFQSVQINNEYPVSYNETGTVNLKLRIVFENGVELNAICLLEIQDFSNNGRWICVGDEQLSAVPFDPPANDPTMFSLAYYADDGNPVNGTYGVWLGCGNNQIRKPILVMHGFNPANSKQLLPCFSTMFSLFDVGLGGAWRGTLYETYNGAYNARFSSSEDEGYPNGAEFLDRLREEGYDIIIPQLNNGTDFVNKNAAFIRGMIYHINAMLDSNDSKHELVVIGYSLGAVSTRYALAKAEQLYELHKNTSNTQFYPHPRCRTWVSVEGEYQGCTTPIALQNHFFFWSQAAYNAGDVLGIIITNMARNTVDNPAARELSNIHRIASTNTHTFPHTDRLNLLNDFANNVGLPGNTGKLKGYPMYCRRIGVSHGSTTGIKNQAFQNIRTKLFDFETSSRINFPIKFHKESEGYTCDPNGYLNTQCTYHREKYMTIFWGLVRINLIPNGTSFNFYENLLEYDWMPGSLLAPTYMYFNPPAPLLIQIEDFYYYPPLSSTYMNYVEGNINMNSFAPTVSTLDLYDKDQIQMSSYNSGLLTDVSSMNLFKLNSNDLHPTSSYGFPYLNNPTDPYKHTPFDAIWGVGSNHIESNRFHVEDPAIDMATYLANVEIAPINLYLSNRIIHDYGDNYRIYRAAYEARNNIIAGFDIYASNTFPIGSNTYVHNLTANGNVLIESRTDVDFRAGNEIHLKPGFEAHYGAQFHAYINPYEESCPDNLKMFSSISSSTVANKKPVHTIETKAKNEDIRIYPNPSDGDFTIQFNSTISSDQTVSIYDLSGKNIKNYTNHIFEGSNVITINLGPYDAGIYYLKISGIEEVKKIIITK